MFKIRVYVDFDWAGCKATRKSTSGGLIFLGNHPLRSWFTAQAVIATSSGEAEVIATFEGTTRAIGLRSMLRDFAPDGQFDKIAVYTDSLVAESWGSTRGLGRMRHLEVKLSWMPERVHRSEIALVKTAGATNAADAMTSTSVQSN